MPAKGTVRIQKILAGHGVASRRAVEQMVLEGRISVNGEVLTKLPCFVNSDIDEIRVDGRRVRLAKKIKRAYYLLNKPTGVVCTQNDPDGRDRAVDMLPIELTQNQRIYCVGRLDLASTGLILMTNDGELTEYLTHPRHEVEKSYHVEIQGQLDENDIATLKRGVYIDGKRTAGAAVKVLRRGRVRSMLEIQLREGRNREIRRVMARLGHKVYTLKRTRIGPIGIRGLKVGNWRELTIREVTKLRHCGLVKDPEAAAKQKTKPKPTIASKTRTVKPTKTERTARVTKPAASRTTSKTSRTARTTKTTRVAKPAASRTTKAATSKTSRTARTATKGAPRRGPGRNANTLQKRSSVPKGRKR